MRLIAIEAIRVAVGVTVPPGTEFESDDYALTERNVAELLAIAAATLAPEAATTTKAKK